MILSKLLIINRLKETSKGKRILKPQRIYYSGSGYSESAVYFGEKPEFKDVIDFWISILTWVSCDEMEFDYPSIADESREHGGNFIRCEVVNYKSEEVYGIFEFLKGLDENLSEPINCYKMSNEWDNKRYLFDFGYKYFCHNWYTGE